MLNLHDPLSSKIKDSQASHHDMRHRAENVQESQAAHHDLMHRVEDFANSMYFGQSLELIKDKNKELFYYSKI